MRAQLFHQHEYCTTLGKQPFLTLCDPFGVSIVSTWDEMGSSKPIRRGWWGVGLVLSAALFSILSVLGDSDGPVLGDRRMNAAGSANSLGINTGSKRADEDGKKKEAAAPGEEATEELPPFGDKSLARDKSIRGRVVDAKGKPVPDAVVVAAYKDTDSYPYALVQASRVRSEEDGSFVLGPLGRRTFWILAIKKEVGVAFVSGKAPGGRARLSR